MAARLPSAEPKRARKLLRDTGESVHQTDIIAARINHICDAQNDRRNKQFEAQPGALIAPLARFRRLLACQAGRFASVR